MGNLGFGPEMLLQAKRPPRAEKAAKGADQEVVGGGGAAAELVVEGEGAAGRGIIVVAEKFPRGDLGLSGNLRTDPFGKSLGVALECGEAAAPGSAIVVAQ